MHLKLLKSFLLTGHTNKPSAKDGHLRCIVSLCQIPDQKKKWKSFKLAAGTPQGLDTVGPAIWVGPRQSPVWAVSCHGPDFSSDGTGQLYHCPRQMEKFELWTLS